MRTSALILVLLAFTGNAYGQAAATPALRVKAVIDNIRNADTPAAQVTRITNRLLPLAAPNVDTAAWTNAQKAQAVLAYLQAEIRREIDRSVRITDLPAATATVSTTATAAASDLD